MLKENDMKRDSVEINHNAPQCFHNAVWNRKYMEPKPGCTLPSPSGPLPPSILTKASPPHNQLLNGERGVLDQLSTSQNGYPMVKEPVTVTTRHV